MQTPDILYEDDTCVAVNKPAGLLVHPSPRQKRGTLAQWLVQTYPALERVGEPPVYSGIVHRLDRRVSGVMLIAKTQASYRRLKQRFKAGAVEKHYTALVYGSPETDTGSIEKRIVGSKGRRKTIRDDSRPELLEKSQYALTHWSATARYGDYALLDVQPVTGRTHQIRVHLASIGHHVVCDDVYAEGKPCLGLKRPFLHASSITVPGEQEEVLSVTAPLPTELRAVMEQIP